MPNTTDTSKKCNNDSPSTSAQKNTSAGSSTSSTRKARKRKREALEEDFDSDWEKELDGCNMQDAVDMETKLRKVAIANNLSEDEMRRLLEKVVKNDHVLALVTLKSEDELAREKREATERTVIITDTPSVPKLTRAKARELNKTPGITLPSLTDSSNAEIAALINDDLHSDEDDEEYTFKEEDFISDEDPNTTASDLDSNPRTPQTPQTHYGESPVKFTPDGCFKVPLEKRMLCNGHDEFRIATRTRSKLCLEQTTIDDIQSEFVPPDVEQLDIGVIDDDWMQFLNDVAKPLNNTTVGDDDDPIADPEYDGTEKVKVDPEELRDVNISKKELTELVAELFEGLLSEHGLLETVDLDTPQKYVTDNTEVLNTTQYTNNEQEQQQQQQQSYMNSQYENLTRQIDFDAEKQTQPQPTTNDTVMSTQLDYSFRPDVMSTPSTMRRESTIEIPVVTTVACPEGSTHKTYALPTSQGEKVPDLIAVPMPGEPNCYQIAKIVPSENIEVYSVTPPKQELQEVNAFAVVGKEVEQNEVLKVERYNESYDSQFRFDYISIKKFLFAEYVEKFEKLRYLPVEKTPDLPTADASGGMSECQYQLIQQQLCMHVQMLTQTFLQTYSHPDYWKFAPKAKNLLLDLQQKGVEHAPFNAWNLNGAVELVQKWEDDLSVDSEENLKMMDFIKQEVELTNRNTRQIPRFCPRIMDVMLNSSVFMYPQYLPRIPFVSKMCSYHSFAPSEYQLIAMGLAKHMQRIADGELTVSKKASPLLAACEALTGDTVFGKTKRRIWDQIRQIRKETIYNPVQFFFEHNRAPPVDIVLYNFENNAILPPKDRFDNLPIVFQKYLLKQKKDAEKLLKKKAAIKKAAASRKSTASTNACNSYVQFVREAVGEYIQLPDTFEEAAQPNGSLTETSALDPTAPVIIQNYQQQQVKNNSSSPKQSNTTPNALVVNLNYIFGTAGDGSLNNSFTLPHNTFNQNNSSCGEANRTAIVLNHTAPAITYANESSVPLTDITNANIDIGNATRSTTYGQRKLTDFYQITKTSQTENKSKQKKPPKKRLYRFRGLSRKYQQIRKRMRLSKLRNDRRYKAELYTRYCLKKKIVKLLRVVLKQRNEDRQRYANVPSVQFYYRHFRALELYTDLLRDLEMEVRNASGSAANGVPRPRSTKKATRTEENFRQMLLPCSPQDVNLRDSTIAFQFYEKVEDVFVAANHPEKFHEFSKILTEFDPKKDKSCDLYYSAEKLFMPDHPELAEAFLLFFLPDEAAEIGKFFEHFMVNNIQTFNEKLRQYFNKQPAQLRKIFGCLEELSVNPTVSMEQIETKILPLLKGNKFLIEWFKQLFAELPPPKSLMPTTEHANLKQVQKNRDGEIIEQINEMPDSPNTEQTDCSLKYINGRIFAGPKMTLPAKLSFMAGNLNENVDEHDEPPEFKPTSACVHGINKPPCNETAKPPGEEPDRSDDDDALKLQIDSTGDSDNSSSNHSIEACDELALRSHAMRLNPNCYNSAYYMSLNASTHGNAKKSAQHHPNTDEGKTSPRKAHSTAPSSPNVNAITSPTTSAAGHVFSVNDSSSTWGCGGGGQQRRKASPVKKMKSPTAVGRPRTQAQPMVVIHERIPAIACAKRLKTLVADDPNESSESDCKERVPIVARSKSTSAGGGAASFRAPMKREHQDDLEFLPVNAEVRRYSSMSSASTTHNSLCSEDEFKVEINNARASSDTATAAAPAAVVPTVSTPESRKQTVPWSRDEDKIVLIEMNYGVGTLDERQQSVAKKLPMRELDEVLERYAFLIDYLKTLGR